MAEDTVPQFGRARRASLSAPEVASAGGATVCPQCGSHFSAEGRFCPFDGGALTRAEGAEATSDPLLGTLVDGRYAIEGVLGEGGVGTVYAVRHKALGKRFALKALRRDLTGDGEMAARFIQEARTAARLSHPGLVEITDFGELVTGQVYFVMELLEGESLARLLRRGALSAERGVEMVRKLAHALATAHAAGVVHRDLKPDNIHVGADDTVKILDFGLAKVLGGSRLTRAGMVFGTPHYMSPEQASGEVVDHRADIYALGVLMYELFTGRVPFEATSYRSVLAKHMYQTPSPPQVVEPGPFAASLLEGVVLRCLQKRPEARYQNLAELLAALDDLERGVEAPSEPSAAEHDTRTNIDAVTSVTPMAAQPLAPTPPSRLRWSAARIFGLLLAAFALPLLAFALWRGFAAVPRRQASSAADSVRAQAVPVRPALARSSAAPLVPNLATSVRTVTPQPRAPLAREPLENANGSVRSKPRSVNRAPLPTPTVTAEPATKAPSRRLGGGEIIDPWQR